MKELSIFYVNTELCVTVAFSSHITILLLLSVRSKAEVSAWGPGIHFLHCWSIPLGPWNPLLALLKYPLGALESTSCTAEVSTWDPGIHFLHCWSIHLGPWNPLLHETNLISKQCRANSLKEDQNQFLTKEIWVRPMSSRATSTSSKSVSCKNYFLPSSNNVMSSLFFISEHIIAPFYLL